MSERNPPGNSGRNSHGIGSDRGVKRPPSMETESLERGSRGPSGMDGNNYNGDYSRQRQSQQIVNDFMASLDAPKPQASDGTGGRKKAPMTTAEKRERKREINRLSAQRKRERERVQLDTLTDRYAQLSYLNEALEGDSKRLTSLLAVLSDILASQVKHREEALKKARAVNQAEEIAEKMDTAEKIRQALLSGVEEGEPTRLHSLDPATGSAAKAASNPFLQTTEDLLQKLKIIETIRQVLIATLQQLLQPQKLSLGHLLSIANASQPTAAQQQQQQQPPPLAQRQVPPPVTDKATQLQQLLLALGNISGSNVMPRAPVPAPSAQDTSPSAAALLELLTRAANQRGSGGSG